MKRGRHEPDTIGASRGPQFHVPLDLGRLGDLRKVLDPELTGRFRRWLIRSWSTSWIRATRRSKCRTFFGGTPRKRRGRITCTTSRLAIIFKRRKTRIV